MSTIEASSATWQVTVPGAAAPVPIGPGLRLDETGHHRPLAVPGDDGALVRLDAEEGILVLRCTSRAWVLATSERMLGDRVTVDRPVELILPAASVRIEGGRKTEPSRLRLERRNSVNWLRPDPAASPHGAPSGPVSGFVTERRRAGEPRRGAPEGPGPAASAALWAERRPARRPERLRAPARPRWPVTLATIAVYLGSLAFSAPVHTPVTAVGPVSAAEAVAKPAGRG